MQITDYAQDRNLHLKFVKLGSDRRRLTNELLALLPEIYECGIYKNYAATIIEYAGKFGGLSKGVVLKRLRLEKHLQDKPLLKESIRTEGVHKVALVAALATHETEEAWVSKLENMSKSALQELSKEVRNRRKEVSTEGDAGLCSGSSDNSSADLRANLYKSSNGDDSGTGLNCSTRAPCKAVPVKITLELDEESSFLFLSLKKKFGSNLGNKEVMKKILEMANAAAVIARSGAKAPSRDHRVGSQLPRDNKNTTPRPCPSVKVILGDNFTGEAEQESGNRYIPVHLKRAALANSNNRCSYPNCNRPPEIFHHTERFAFNQNHKSITPICKIHHEFAHNGLILNEKQPSKNWQMTNQIDHLYRWQRRLAIEKFG